MKNLNQLAAAFACLALAACSPSAPPTTAAPPAAPPQESAASAAPANIGECVRTTVTLVGPRLEGVPDSGSAIVYANGLAQVDYAAIAGIDHSQPGDAVELCLSSIPENCPPGDNRGRVYSATNTRTGETWSAPDSQHSCGGA